MNNNSVRLPILLVLQCVTF